MPMWRIDISGIIPASLYSVWFQEPDCVRLLQNLAKILYLPIKHSKKYILVLVNSTIISPLIHSET